MILGSLIVHCSDLATINSISTTKLERVQSSLYYRIKLQKLWFIAWVGTLVIVVFGAFLTDCFLALGALDRVCHDVIANFTSKRIKILIFECRNNCKFFEHLFRKTHWVLFNFANIFRRPCWLKVMDAEIQFSITCDLQFFSPFLIDRQETPLSIDKKGPSPGT